MSIRSIICAAAAGMSILAQPVLAQLAPPSGLMTELLAHPERTVIETTRPSFAWIVNDPAQGARQQAFEIHVASSRELLASDRADVWNSNRVVSSKSTGVAYGGAPLKPNSTYFWAVRTWNGRGEMSGWSAHQEFRTGAATAPRVSPRYPLVQEAVAPVNVVATGEDSYFVDFGRDAFGTVQFTLTSPQHADSLIVHLGEKLAGASRIDRRPGGTIRYRRVAVALTPGTSTYRVEIPPDQRNTGPQAIKMPPHIGEVVPFRYVELERVPAPITAASIRQLRVTYPFDEAAADFISSDSVLNAVWELSKYSIHATTFAGVYVDGDRERIPYEADAYINQLGHYNLDREYSIARYSQEYLISHATWPTEWILHSVLMAWEDYTYTGDTISIARYYDDLKAKTLMSLAREDGLISTQTGRITPDILRAIHFDGKLNDIVDWPESERDGYELRPINTVVNAFHYEALRRMGDIAGALGRSADARDLRSRAERVKQSINQRLLDTTRGVYIDGEGSAHSASHANLFPLAFGIVPDRYRDSVLKLLDARGMAVSVYAAQYLLDGLYRAGDGAQALKLLTSTGPRGWAHMIYDVGSTITLEAWDQRFKPNLDWNHAWGAAPANTIPRWLMGVRPLSPGFERMIIQPQPDTLSFAQLRLPTIRGTVFARFENRPDTFRLEVRIPANTSARVALPLGSRRAATLKMDGKRTVGRMEGKFLIIDSVGAGSHTFELQR